MSNNDSNDLFSKMLGTVPASAAESEKKHEDSDSHTVESPSAEAEKNDAPFTENQKSKSENTNHFSSSLLNQPATSSFSSKKSSSKKIDIKKFFGITVALVAVIIILSVAFSIFLPAKTNASKIKKDFLGSEISEIYSNKIAGNSLREKIFANSLKNYPEEVKAAYMDEKIDYNQAKSIFSALVSSGLFDDSNISEAKTFVESIELSKEAFASGEKLLAQNELNEALKQFAKVVKEDKNYDAAQSYISQCGIKYKENVVSSSSELLANGNYEEAISLLEEAAQLLPNDSEISFTLKKAKEDYAGYLKNTAITEGKVYINNKNYPEAINVINAALKNNVNDSELAALLNTAKSEYVSAVITQVDSLISKYDYSKAESVIDAALEILPDNNILKNKKSEIENSKPASLSDLLMLNNSGWEWNKGTPKDPFGTDYSNSKNYAILEYIDYSWEHSKYGEFRAYKKYSHLTGRVAPYENMSEEGSTIFQIFADDKLVYTSPEITRKTDAFTFNVNINNADYIKIITEVDGSEGIIFSDLSLFMD